MAEIQIFQNTEQDGASFVHLHVHSNFSLKNGSANVKSLVEKAKSLNMHALALTDVNNLISILDFEKACRANEIQPIIGEEIIVSDEDQFYNLVLLCKDINGYKNLCQLSGITFAKKYTARKHYVTLDDLKKFSEGLFCLSGGKSGAFFNLIQTGKIEEAEKRAISLRKIYRENFYFELQNHRQSEEISFSQQLYNLGQKLHIPCVITNEVDYLDKSNAEENEVLRCIRNRKRFQSYSINPEHYLKSYQEMKELLPEFSDAFNNTNFIASKCNFTIPSYPKDKLGDFLQQIVPPKDYWVSDNSDENQRAFLKILVNTGLKNRYKYISDKIRKRADEELSLIYEKNLTNFFLIVWEYVYTSKKTDILMGAGKGEVICSIVAYALEITDIDPLKYNLPFERFLNKTSNTIPNIDVEFDATKTSKIMQHIKLLYGEKKVANILSIKKYSHQYLKNLLEDIGHTLGIEPSDLSNITDKLPTKNFVSLQDAFSEPTEFSPNKGCLLQFKNDFRYSKLFNLAFALEGSILEFTVHHSGVVISKDDISTLVPVCSDSKTEEQITQFTAKDLQSRGLYIFDFIDSTKENFLRKCEDIIIKNHSDSKFSIDKISLYDEATYNFFSTGKTEDILGLESSEAQETLPKLKPQNFDEFTAFIAMNRPEQFNQIQNYINRKENPSLVEYPAPNLKNILKETFGLIIYQEQFLYCLQELSGKSLTEIDKLRKIMSKPRNDSYEKIKGEFISAIAANGFEQDQAEKLFNRIAMTASFGFLKAEAVSLAKAIYQIAWVKVHYPEEFKGAKNTMNAKHWWENYSIDLMEL